MCRTRQESWMCSSTMHGCSWIWILNRYRGGGVLNVDQHSAYMFQPLFKDHPPATRRQARRLAVLLGFDAPQGQSHEAVGSRVGQWLEDVLLSPLLSTCFCGFKGHVGIPFKKAHRHTHTLQLVLFIRGVLFGFPFRPSRSGFMWFPCRVPSRHPELGFQLV